MTSTISYTSLANDEQAIYVKIFVQNNENEATLVLRNVNISTTGIES